MSEAMACAAVDSKQALSGSESRPPLIGLPMPTELASWRVWQGPAHLLNTDYVEQLRRAGAAPVLMPTGGTDAEAAAVVEVLDGFLLAGGADVHPSLFGQVAHPQAGPFDRERDSWEVALLRNALTRELPVFAICRGMQLVNVLFGGTLVQHLPDHVGNESHLPVVGEMGVHQITTAPGSRVYRAVGPASKVPTYHHQAVGEIGVGLTATAWADDGTAEALEDEHGRILAVQWHPEASRSNAVFRHFVNSCTARPAGSSSFAPPAR